MYKIEICVSTYLNLYSCDDVDCEQMLLDLYSEMMVNMGYNRKEVEDVLSQHKYNDIMATYLLLGSRRSSDVSLSLYFCTEPYVPRVPQRDLSNRRLYEHGMYRTLPGLELATCSISSRGHSDRYFIFLLFSNFSSINFAPMKVLPWVVCPSAPSSIRHW